MRAKILSLLTTFLFAGMLPAQSQQPVIVQAATPGVTKSQTATAPEKSNSSSLQAALTMLLEMKAANEETLRKQAATLAQLEELEKAADQIRVFTRRN
jgi:outer membrane protein assembly factor BamA